MGHAATRRKSGRQNTQPASVDGTRRPAPQQILATHLREQIAPEKRRAMVEEAAYFYAERRGFEPGHELDDWLAAEDQIAAALALADLGAAASRGDTAKR